MRRILCILFLNIIYFNYGQAQDKINEILPPTQESFLRTQFGKIPVNEYKGMQKISIPIHNIIVDKINIPINLNYTTLGVRAGEIPNDVGMNWILETGGVINRTIRGIADEMATKRVLYNSEQEVLSLDTQDGSQTAAELNQAITLNNFVDLEPDIFNFTFPEGTGSFYFDKNYDPIIITDDKTIIVKYNKLDKSFIITTNKGTKYYFGGESANETTSIRRNAESEAITSYYLTMVEDSNNRVIKYHYSKLNKKIYFLKGHQEGLLYINQESSENCQQFSNDRSKPIRHSLFQIKNPIVLDSITAENNMIIFERSLSHPSPTRLNSIKILYAGKKRKEIKLTYLKNEEQNSEQRFFLKTIQSFFFDFQNEQTLNDVYAFEYDNPQALPDRLSYNIDYLGYYNGANNSELLPNTDYFKNFERITNSFGIPIENDLGFADRRTNFNFAKLGTLKAVIYPTKGKTEFEYESIPAKKRTYSSDSGVIDIHNLGAVGTLEFDGALVDDKEIELKIEIGTTAEYDRALYELVIKNINTGELVISKKYLLSTEGKPDLKIIAEKIQINQASKYKIELKILNKFLCVECYSFLSIKEYPTGWEKTEDAGLRLKRVYDYTSETTAPTIKRYYYSSFDKINKLPENESFKPTFLTKKVLSKNFDAMSCCLQHSPMNGCGSTNIQFRPISATAISLDSNPTNLWREGNDYANPVYDIVTISHGGDNFETGGEEKIFSSPKESLDVFGILVTPRDFPAPYGYDPDGDFGYSNFVNNLINDYAERVQRFERTHGLLLENRIFENKNNKLNLKKVISNYYNMQETKKLYTISGEKAYDKIFYPSGVAPGTTTSNLFIAYFPLVSYNNNLVKTRVKEYFEDVPLNLDIENDGLYKKVENITNLSFANSLHNMITQEKRISTDESTQTTEYQYSYEKGNTYLIEKNIVGIPLETEVKKNNVTVSKSYTHYPTSQEEANNKTSGLPLPYQVDVLNLKENKLQKEISYDKYDNKGNLLQYTTKNGTPTTIIWGYNQTQPIAKIEGAKYDDVKNTATEIITASNTDANQPPKNDESNFLNILAQFRQALPNYPVTTYTYDPLIGVRSITPPNGITEYYFYDDANRLEFVKTKNTDGSMKVVKEYKYNYKQP